MGQFRKRMSSNTLAMALILSSLAATPVSADNIEFKDIKGHWAQKQINNFLQKGYVDGYGDNTFRPNNKITRAEFVKIVNRAFGFNEKGEENFVDVNSGDWFYDEILKAMNTGYIDGYGDNTFKPNDSISREEACKIIGVIIEANGVGNTAFKDDKEIEDWAKKYVKGLVDMGIIKGFEDNTFRPKDNNTRAEAVYTLDGSIENKSTIVSNSKELINAVKNAKEGGIILLNAGEYTANLTLTRSITIKGIDAANTILNGKINASVESIENINISDMTINADNQHITLLQNTNVKSISIDNVVFNHLVSANQPTMLFWGTQETGGYDLISITNSTFNYPNAVEADQAYVGQTYDANKVVFSNNIINEKGKGTIRKGFELSGKVDEFIANNNRFDKTKNALQIWICEGSEKSVFSLNNNTITNSTIAGINIDAWTGNTIAKVDAINNKGEISITSKDSYQGKFNSVEIKDGTLKGVYTK